MERFLGFRRAWAMSGRRPGGSVLSMFGEVEAELGWVICASRRWRPQSIADRPNMVLPAQFPGENPVERLPVRKGEPADQTPKIIPQMEIPPLVPKRPLERPAAALPDLTDGKRQHGEQSKHVAQRVAAVPLSSRRSVTRVNVVVFPLSVVSTSSGMFTLRSKFPSSGNGLQSRSNRCIAPRIYRKSFSINVLMCGPFDARPSSTTVARVWPLLFPREYERQAHRCPWQNKMQASEPRFKTARAPSGPDLRQSTAQLEDAGMSRLGCA